MSARRTRSSLAPHEASDRRTTPSGRRLTDDEWAMVQALATLVVMDLDEYPDVDAADGGVTEE